MSEPTVPIFSTDYSVGESILTAANETEIKDSSPVSVPAIAYSYKLPFTFVVERNLSSYWKLYDAFKDADKGKLVFAVKLEICSDNLSFNNDEVTSSIIIAMKNSEAYPELVRLVSEASVRHKTTSPRLDWNMLQELVTPNMSVMVPFYSGFIARNLMKFNSAIIPRFGEIEPTFLVEDHNLPFDNLLRCGVSDFCLHGGHKILNTHQVYYYRNSDFVAHQTFRCIAARTIFEKPNLDFYSSDEFSFESWLKNNGQSIR